MAQYDEYQDSGTRQLEVLGKRKSHIEFLAILKEAGVSLVGYDDIQNWAYKPTVAHKHDSEHMPDTRNAVMRWIYM